MIHSSYVAFVIGQRSPSLTSRNVIFSVKLERPHGSIEMVRKHSGSKGNGGGCEVSLQLLSLPLCGLLAKADGKCEHEEGKRQRCTREGKKSPG
jgi:hypothetical protein